MPITLGCLVEGEGEKGAVPALVRRIALELDPAIVLRFEMRRIDRTKAVKPAELQRVLEPLGKRAEAVLLLLDSDDDPACRLGPELLGQLSTCIRHIPSAVVLAEREFECWFIGAASSLGIETGAPDPQAIRNGKGWLTGHMNGGPYSPVLHQTAFSCQMDLDAAARNCSSFAKFRREVDRLLRAIRPQADA